MSVTTFHDEGDKLVLRYEPSDGGDWVTQRLKTQHSATVRKVFHVTEALLCSDPWDNDDEVPEDMGLGVCAFNIGNAENAYFRLNREVFGIDYDLFLSRDIRWETRHFIAVRDISIFARFDAFSPRTIHVGGEHPEAIPEDVFEQLIANFPTTTEVDKYARVRIESLAGDYLNSPKDFRADFENYRNKKRSAKGSQPRRELADYEGDKFSALISKLQEMLNGVTSYSEKQWQDEILQIIRFLFPRYIHAIPEGRVYDSWQQKKRRVDFLLVDATGYVDIIEIKRPTFGEVLTQNTGRDNYLPRRSLSEAVMQVEKYLFHLNRSGEGGEKSLNDKHQKELPNDLNIRIVNPSGMIIMGRDGDFTDQQRSDFEVIRRKYRSVVDIITYDDLLRRLKMVRDQFQRLSKTSNT